MRNQQQQTTKRQTPSGTTVNRNKMVGLARDVTEYLIALTLFLSRDREAVRCIKTLYIKYTIRCG